MTWQTPRSTILQNFIALRQPTPEIFVTKILQTKEQKKQKNSNDISLPCLSACGDKKLLFVQSMNVQCTCVHCINAQKAMLSMQVIALLTTAHQLTDHCAFRPSTNYAKLRSAVGSQHLSAYLVATLYIHWLADRWTSPAVLLRSQTVHTHKMHMTKPLKATLMHCVNAVYPVLLQHK